MGYNAIHMTVKFQPNKYGETYAEIQIMGSDIAALKDVEDLTYKIRCNKAIQKKYPKAFIIPASIDEIMLMYVKGEIK